MANNFKLPTITTTIQEVPVSYPQPDGTFADGVLVTQFKVLKRTETDEIDKSAKEIAEKTDVSPDVRHLYLSNAVIGISNVVDDAGVVMPPENAKTQCLDDPILRLALWNGYVEMINKSPKTDK